MQNKKISFIKIKKKDGQIFFKLLNKYFKAFQIINSKFKVEHSLDYIYFPLIEDKANLENFIQKITNELTFEIILKEGEINSKYKPRNLNEFLKNKISHEFFELIPKSYDILGKIAIIEFNNTNDLNDEDLISIKKEISNAIIMLNKNVDTVFEKKSEIKGNYRIRELEFLNGVKNSETIYKENNCIFKLDVLKTFFTPRLIYERKRISEINIKENELIIDLFAGVGPYSIQIAQKHNVDIYSFDINPIAFQYFLYNIEMNLLKGNVFPYNIDIKLFLDPNYKLRKKLENSADRIIMNLPENAIEFINIACILMKKSGCILHIYQFCEKTNPIKKAIENIKVKLEKQNWNIKEILISKIVKSYSPKSEMVVVDAFVKSKLV